MNKKLVLLNELGQVVRVFPAEDKNLNLFVIYRDDRKKVEVVKDFNFLKSQEVSFEILSEFKLSDIEEQDLSIGRYGRLSLKEVGSFKTVSDVSGSLPRAKIGRAAIIAMAIYLMLGISLTLGLKKREENVAEKETKKEIVKIVKKKIRLNRARRTVAIRTRTVSPTPVKTKKALKRRGALGILGSLKKSLNKGGLNVNAINTTRGAGLGGKGGSGGIQTSLYAKGVISAALGPGANIQGGGGYGTKGKGGGQAGYGDISMVGSAGSSAIPVPTEATEVDGGLSMDMVADVVRRNIGQVRYCYEQGLQANPSLKGRVAVAWVIDGNGRVARAGVKNTSLNNNSVEQCIISKLKTWKFPTPDGNVNVKVSYPFLLKKLGRG